MENEKAYKDLINVINVIKELYPTMTDYQQEKLQGVWPELTESEDERIRKSIIDGLKLMKERGSFVFVLSDIDKAIAWLEKQGEQKPVEWSEEDDYGIDGIWHAERILEETLGKVKGYQSDDGILEHNAAITAIKKLKEEKSKVYATLREELENEWNKCCPEDEGMGLEIAHVEHNQFDEIAMRFYEMGLERKSIKWSDEDESMYTRCIGILGKCYMKELPQNVEEELDWLKSLKNRVLPQQKQEWSEEDEKMIEDCIGAIAAADYYSYEDKQKMEKWLESLKPNHWKPSVEQMKRLQCAIRILKGVNEHTDAKYLEELFDDLKKL